MSRVGMDRVTGPKNITCYLTHTVKEFERIGSRLTELSKTLI